MELSGQYVQRRLIILQVYIPEKLELFNSNLTRMNRNPKREEFQPRKTRKARKKNSNKEYYYTRLNRN